MCCYLINNCGKNDTLSFKNINKLKLYFNLMDIFLLTVNNNSRTINNNRQIASRITDIFRCL